MTHFLAWCWAAVVVGEARYVTLTFRGLKLNPEKKIKCVPKVEKSSRTPLF